MCIRDSHEADGHVHHGDDADDGGVHAATFRLVDGVAQHEVRDDDEHEDEVGGLSLIHI